MIASVIDEFSRYALWIILKVLGLIMNLKSSSTYFVICLFVTLAYWIKSPKQLSDLPAHLASKISNNERNPASDESCRELTLGIINKNIQESKLREVKTLLKEYKFSSAEVENVNSYEDAIKLQYEQIISTGRGVNQSNQMALFGKRIRELYLNDQLSTDAIKDLDLTLGLSVIRAEQYIPKEYRVVKDSSYALGRNSKMIHADYKKFKEYTISFEDRIPPYSNFDLTGGTVISLNDFREIEAQNLFPVYIPHDMTHVRYALHHERYFPVLFSAARSKNHFRYVLMGSLSEGVDTVQFVEEIAITKYFRDIKKLDNEEGLLWLARATEEELIAVAEAIGHRKTYTNLASNFKNWAPTVSKNHPAEGVTGVGFDQEVEDMAAYLKRQHTDPDLVNRYRTRRSEILVYTGDVIDENPDAAVLK